VLQVPVAVLKHMLLLLALVHGRGGQFALQHISRHVLLTKLYIDEVENRLQYD
jgi:uncharacterized protein (DUF779 family)